MIFLISSGACTSAVAALEGIPGRTSCRAAKTTTPTRTSLPSILIDRVLRSLLHGLLHIPVRGLGVKAAKREILTDLVGDHDRSVVSAGAAERDREIALAFANVVREQIDQQLRDPLDEFLGLRERPDVARHAGMAAR